MESTSKAAVILPPVKNPHRNLSKDSILSKISENENPNHKHSPLTKPGSVSISKSRKSAFNNPNPSGNSSLVKSRIRERKFVVAKKTKRSGGLKESKEVNVGCKCSKGNGKLIKCLCVAYESLRASQEEFFRGRIGFDEVGELNFGEDGDDKNEGLIGNGGIGKGCEKKVEEYGSERLTGGIGKGCDEKVEEYGNEGLVKNGGIGKGCEEKVEECENVVGIGEEGMKEMGFSAIKRSRDRLLEEARECVPEPGSGRVMYLVKAFEKMKLMSILKLSEYGVNDENKGESKYLKWALPGLQVENKAPESQSSSSSFCPSDLYLTSECLGLDSCRSSSLDSYRGRNSSESSLASARRKCRNRQQLKTTAKPFKLRTEERGKCKEEEFMRKVQHMMEEEEKLRVPTAQGLPWTTDEPEYLAKPPIKEATRPIDLILHSDVRAEERAEFDQQVAEKMSITEQYRMEKRDNKSWLRKKKSECCGRNLSRKLSRCPILTGLSSQDGPRSSLLYPKSQSFIFHSIRRSNAHSNPGVTRAHTSVAVIPVMDYKRQITYLRGGNDRLAGKFVHFCV